MRNLPRDFPRRWDGLDILLALLMIFTGSFLGLLASELESGLWDKECIDAKFQSSCYWLNHHAGLVILGLLWAALGFIVLHFKQRTPKR